MEETPNKQQMLEPDLPARTGGKSMESRGHTHTRPGPPRAPSYFLLQVPLPSKGCPLGASERSGEVSVGSTPQLPPVTRGGDQQTLLQVLLLMDTGDHEK